MLVLLFCCFGVLGFALSLQRPSGASGAWLRRLGLWVGGSRRLWGVLGTDKTGQQKPQAPRTAAAACLPRTSTFVVVACSAEELAVIFCRDWMAVGFESVDGENGVYYAGSGTGFRCL